ncbi:glycosyltransferase [Candidatus Parcubacteria bacterium]|jgi:glycosyltransferase involved in cell wall biosynthesis|nr:MAG: glycosyltransferase [Candidatus Parcubacteria bacterium]
MKVCFVSPFAYSLFNPKTSITHGGAEIDLFLIATELSKNPGFKVVFITGDFGQPKIENYGRISLQRSFRTDLRGWRKKIYSLFMAAPKLLSALNQADADIYMQEGIGPETAIIAWFCRRYQRKFVYRIASTVDCNGEVTQRWPIMGRLFLFGLRRAEKIIAQDQTQSELLKKQYGLPAQIIHNATLIPNQSEILPAEQRRHLLWVGRLVKMKHPEIFLQIAENHPDETFVMIAPRDPNEQNLAKELAGKSASLPNVNLIPGLKHYELNKYYRQAKLLINTSDFEGYPNTFIEAGKYGVPVITLNANPDKFFDDNRFGECANGDVGALFRSISDWLKDSTKRQKAGSAFSEYVRSTNNLSENIKTYVSIFNHLA